MELVDFTEALIPMKDKIFRFARSILIDCSEAEDVTQDIFERLWKAKDTLDGYTNLEAFVMVSVRNLCYDRLRSRRVRDDKYGDIKASIPNLSVGFSPDDIDVGDVVGRLIARLPDRQRMVIHLRDVESCGIDEIAEIVGLDSPTVRVLLSRARKTVREKMIKIMDYGVK